MPAPMHSKNTNSVVSVNGDQKTIHIKGKKSNEFIIVPSTGSTARPGQRIDFNYNFQAKAGTMLKDAFINYRLFRGAAAGPLHSRHPLVENIQEIRLNLNGGDNQYVLQGPFDVLQAFYRDNKDKYPNLQSFELGRGSDSAGTSFQQGGAPANRKVIDNGVFQYSLGSNEYTECTHQIRMKDLLGGLMSDIELSHLRSFNMSILLRSAPTDYTKHWYMGVLDVDDYRTIEFTDLEMKIHTEEYPGPINHPQKPFLTKHMDQYETVLIENNLQINQQIQINLKNKFSPFKNLQGVNLFVKPSVFNTTHPDYRNVEHGFKQFAMKRFISGIVVKHNGVIVKTYSHRGVQLRQEQIMDKENKGLYSHAPHYGLEEEMGMWDGYIDLSKVKVESDPYHSHLVNGQSNDISDSSSPEIVIEVFMGPDEVETGDHLFATVVATRTYHLGDAKKGFLVTSDR